MSVWLFVLLAACALCFATYCLGERIARRMAAGSDQRRGSRLAEFDEPGDRSSAED